MYNKVLWVLDNEIDPAQFERLCIDLLYRSGYRDIVPIEPQDGGRDAELRSGRSQRGEQCFFQFSTEQDWKKKLRSDMKRVYDRGHRPSHFVFVTSCAARGLDRDAVEREARDRYQWDLTIFSREWLRLQLEEGSPDLAAKYLGVPDLLERATRTIAPLSSPSQGDSGKAWQLLEAGDYEHAAAEFKNVVVGEALNGGAWEALAWAQYQTGRYDEAMAAINRAIGIRDTSQSQAIRACILTERGIERDDRASLLEARDTFVELLRSEGERWTTAYNCGNVLSALGDHATAVQYYKQAARLNERAPEVWKNLGSAYHMLGDHNAELECFDRALELDPLKIEALTSKGVSLLVDFDDADRAAALLQRAYTVDKVRATKWPHIWYWLTQAHIRAGRPEAALQWANAGLAHYPGYRSLRQQKSDILATLSTRDHQWREESLRFWRRSLEIQPLDLTTRVRLIETLESENQVSAAWDVVDDCFVQFGVEGASVRTAGCAPSEAIAALEALPLYARLRKSFPVGRYWESGDLVLDALRARPYDERFVKRITTHLALPFGRAIKGLGGLAKSKRPTTKAITRLLNAFLVDFKTVMTQASSELATLINDETSDDSKITVFTNIIMFVGMIALKESGRQFGWMQANVEFDPHLFERALDKIEFDELQADVVTGCLEPINEITHLFPSVDKGAN